jgi:phage-related minor tail protein
MSTQAGTINERTALTDIESMPEPMEMDRPRPRCAETGVSSREWEAGLLRASRLRWMAHWTERAAEAEPRILQSRVRLAQQQKQLAEVELEAWRSLAHSARFAEEEEAERQMRQRVRRSTPEEARGLLERDVEVAALLLEREVLRYQRQTVPFGGTLTTPSLPPGPSSGSLQVHISDEQIEALAIQALARLGKMDREETERAWSEWRGELLRRLPAYAAAEVIRRAEELRHLVR